MQIVEADDEVVALHSQHLKHAGIMIEQGLVEATAINSIISARPAVAVSIGDFRTAQSGDLCTTDVCCADADRGLLQIKPGLEVGHVFYLGSRYSASFKAMVDGQSQRPVEMGCYGLGISRILAAVVANSRDAHGLSWPTAIAPHRAVVIPVDGAMYETALRIARDLDVALGGDVIAIEDRIDHSPGRKMKESQFLGFPYMLIFGRAMKEKGLIEVEIRRTGQKIFVAESELLPLLSNQHQV